ncbi:MAG: hypothetical protein IJN25_01390 [Clostridia bacterium]|nr:hypothetical protein [Clostridia bacterium]
MYTTTLKNSFLTPDAEYTLYPFWFWNDAFSFEEIDRQILDFKSKGVDGFIIHPRIGVPENIPYLSDTFMEFVRHAVETAAKEGMHVILYDEAMYPSGSCHGMVVAENPAYASRGLRMEEGDVSPADGEELVASVTLGDKKYTFLEGFTDGRIRGIHFGEDDGEPGAPASTDLLNPEAVSTYIRLTHDRYYEVVGEYFGNTIIAMFTDEPSIMGREHKPGMKPWTHGFLDYYINSGGSYEDLPHFWLDIDETSSEKRKKYRRTYTTLLGEVYFKTISEWCRDHAIALAGHPGASDEITLLQYFHIPGQDLIFRRVAPENGSAIEGIESVQAKCSSDAARHSGRRRNMNECFACSGQFGEWSFTAEDMKWMADWLFVRGVNMLVPHAFFYSMRDARKDERPPDVGPNNLWWPYYDKFALYAKRMSYMLTDAVNQARVAVLCGAWALPHESVKPFYTSQIEFNYLDDENLLRCTVENGTLRIKKQVYTHIFVEDSALVTPPVQKILDEFEKGGGIVDYGICSASPQVQLFPHSDMLRVTHFIKDGTHFYLLVNEGDVPVAGRLQLDGVWRAEAWDAWNGTITDVNLDAFYLERRQSILLCAVEEAEEVVLDTWSRPLTDWLEDESLCSFSGSITYETIYTAATETDAVLSLGRVENIAEITVNGKQCAVCMWAPYSCTVHLEKGENRIEVRVTNTLANRWGKNPLPSGLFGPCTLHCRIPG